MAIVAATPAANEPATTEPEGSRTGSPACSVRGEVAVWCAGAGAGYGGSAGTVVVGIVARGLAAVGAGAVGSDGGVGAGAAGGGTDGADGAGGHQESPARVDPVGVGSVTPPGWGLPSLSW